VQNIHVTAFSVRLAVTPFLAVGMLIHRLSTLYRPFILYGDYRPWQDEAAAALSKALQDEESAVELDFIQCCIFFAPSEKVHFFGV
jgi:hypothetical protein